MNSFNFFLLYHNRKTNHFTHTELSNQTDMSLLRVSSQFCRHSPVCVAQSQGAGLLKRQQGCVDLDRVADTGHIPEDRRALLFTAQLAALSSFLPVSETNSSCAYAASPSMPFTRTVAARGKAGGCSLSDQHKSLSLSPFLLLSSSSLSLLQALCRSSVLATGSRG